MKSLFTGIDSSSHTAVSFAQVIYSFMSFFKKSVYLIYFIANFIFKSITWNLFSRIPYYISIAVSVSVITFPDSRFRVLVLPVH